MQVLLNEHLYNVLRGSAEFTSPPYFYPQQGVLGLFPAFLLSSVPYAVLRFAGCDPYVSFQLVLILLSFACAMATLVVCVRYLQIRPWIALCAAALITFPNNLFVKAGVGHTNMLMLYVIPVIVALALWGLEDFPRITLRSILRVALASALYALLFASDVYIAWMSGLTLLIVGVVVALALRGRLVIFLRENMRPLAALLATAGAAFAIAFIPFLLIYMPVRALAPLRQYREYIMFAPLPIDLINVSPWNLIWGAVVERFVANRGGEHLLAVTPVMTAVTLVLSVALSRGAFAMERWRSVLVGAAISTWSIGWLLTMKIGTASGFWLVRYLVPGALAIRSGMRLQLVANIWIVIALALLLEHWLRIAPARSIGVRRWAALGVLAFCLVEQINLMKNSEIRRSDELAFLAAVPPPPAACQAFYALPHRQQDARYLDEQDAMWIANQIHLPTLNGFAGWFPPGWNLLQKDGDQTSLVRQWIEHSGLTGQVCSYDAVKRQWALFR
ncbi:hypothetical protein [Rhodoplanes sp. Z2-YC6860]|uniref:hypothetical protein n=1 Tax=Rhodoplanes sp. Z2-YC6860 TaxID=674703 RepID=UPI0018DC96EC|nr:hypothetical protein [Rhodoplanes sp. Z2-YC6860]